MWRTFSKKRRDRYLSGTGGRARRAHWKVAGELLINDADCEDADPDSDSGDADADVDRLPT